MREMKDSGVEWIGKIPKDWELTKIGSVYQERNIKVSDKKYKPLSVTKHGIVPQLENAAKTDNGDNRKLIKRGDFVINSRSDRRGSCGVSVYEGSCSLINNVLQPRKDVNNSYYGFVFRSECFADEFYRWGNGIVDDLWSTKWSSMKRIYIPAPSLEEQCCIADYLKKKCKEIDDIIVKQQKIIEKLNVYKQSIITETVTKGLNSDVELKDSEIEFIGEIPSTWKVCRLRNIGVPQNGISKGGEFFGHGYPFVSYGDVYRNYTLPIHFDGLIDTTDNERKDYSVEKGDIFFTRTSETVEEVGFSSVCEKTIPNATFAGFVIRVRPFDDTLFAGYSKYYFRSSHHRAFLVKEMNLVTRASLGQDLLKSMPVLVPPMGEQKEIAKFLDRKCSAIDDAIETKQKIIHKMVLYKKSLIYEIVTGKREVK